jgi:hypothetical protein
VDYTFRPDEVNRNGLTWKEYFSRTGKTSYAVDSNWSPVLSEHEEMFRCWREEPKRNL